MSSGGCGSEVSKCSKRNGNGSERSCCGTMSSQDPLTERKLKLTPMEFRVTQERETERPYSNKYNKHFEAGNYHCVVCDTELFKSNTKFESKSGWPAFSNVVDAKRIKLTPDLSHVGANLLLLVAKPDLARTEVSCANCNAHLGHLFKDGPKPTGLRYCINSSSLIFYSSSTGESGNTEVSDIAVVDTSASSTTNGDCNKDGKVPMRTSCLSSCGQDKICFFQSVSPETSGATTTTQSNGKPTTQANGKSKPPKMVNSSSSGCLGSKSRWADADPSSNSIVRRRISLFSSSASRPIERISIPPKTFILRETSL